MKQALTAGGSVSLWVKSAKLAFYRMRIDFEEDHELALLKGTHPDYGKIVIHFVVPVQGKTRMEISFQNEAFIAEFKKTVIPAFKYVSESMQQQTQSKSAAKTVPQKTSTEEKVPEKESQSSEDQTEKISDKDKDDANTDQTKSIVPEKHQETRLCKYCRAELREEDKICPKCGKKQNKGLLIAGIIAGVLILAALIGFAVYKMTKTDTAQTDASNSGTGSEVTENSDQEASSQSQLVSLDQYNQIQNGMSYEQVCAIMGREGTFLEPETQVTDSDGQVSILKTYYWEAQGSQGANICVTFSNDAVATFTQYGLE